MKRRAIIAFVSIILCFGLVGCHANGSDGDSDVGADVSAGIEDTVEDDNKKAEDTEEITEDDSKKADDTEGTTERTTEGLSELPDNKAETTEEDVKTVSGSNSNQGEYPSINTLSDWVSISNRDGDVRIAVRKISNYKVEGYDYEVDEVLGPQHGYISLYGSSVYPWINYILVEDNALEARKQLWMNLYSTEADLTYNRQGTVTNDLGMEFQYLSLEYKFPGFDDEPPVEDFRFFYQLTGDTVLEIQVVNCESGEIIKAEDFQWLLDSTILVINED